MENNQTWSKTDIANVLALVIGTIVTLLVLNPEPIDFSFLPFAAAQGALVSPFVLMGIITALFVLLTLLTGSLISLISVRSHNRLAAMQNDETFQTQLSNVSKYERAKLDEWQHKRPTRREPYYPLTYGAVVAFGVTVVGLLLFSLPVFDLMFPQLLGMKWAISLISGLIAAVLVAWRVRPATLDAVDATDNEGLPWMELGIIVSGLLVVGLGAGLILYFFQ